MVLRLCAAICGAVILFACVSSAMAKLATTNVYSNASRIVAKDAFRAFRKTDGRHRRVLFDDACAASQGRIRCTTASAPMGTIVGAASMYDPFQPGFDEGGTETASGELYDPVAWTAAIQTGLRETFGGVHHGKDYQPAYALVEAANKQAIIKINDVGPLKPGRIIDFSRQTMRYFDPSLRRGVVQNVKITPLRGDGWAPGPING